MAYIPLWEQKTMPLPRLKGALLQHFLWRHGLTIWDVARVSQVRLPLVWRATCGLPISAQQAARLRLGLYLLTGSFYHASLCTHDGSSVN